MAKKNTMSFRTPRHSAVGATHTNILANEKGDLIKVAFIHNNVIRKSLEGEAPRRE